MVLTGKALLDIIHNASDDGGYRPPTRPDEKQKAALREMQRLVARCADELDIAAEIIAPRKELAAAMLGSQDVRVLRGWRRDLVGERLLELL